MEETMETTDTLTSRGEGGNPQTPGSMVWYFEQAPKTASYPHVGNNPYYVFNGLLGEMGEVIQLIKKIERNHLGDIAPKREAMLDEIGDCFWYLRMLLMELPGSNPLLITRPRMIRKSWTHTKQIDASSEVNWRHEEPVVLALLEELAHHAMLESVRLMTYVHAHSKHTDALLMISERPYLVIGRIAGSLDLMIQLLGSCLSDVLIQNIAKLHGRAAAGTIAKDRG